MVAIAALAGCKTESPNYCPPSESRCSSPPGDGSSGGHCSSDGDCTANLPACELTIDQGTCKPCSASNIGVCAGTTPRCENNACVACVDDNDCSGGAGVCLPTGGCAATSRIIYASSTSGSNSKCGDVATPCSLTGALGLVTADKDVIKLDDTNKATFVSAPGFIVSKNVTIDARTATLNRGDDGSVLTINEDKSLTLLGGIISNATGNGGDGVKCGHGSTLAVFDSTITSNNEAGISSDGCMVTVVHAKISSNSKAQPPMLFAGIEVSNGGSLTISRSQIVSNRGGGITVGMNSTFTIVGNMFLNNGDGSGLVGGLQATTTVPGNRLDFNTLSGNTATTGIAAGIQCTAPAVSTAAPPPPLTAQNNIIWDNNGASAVQVSGTCLHAYSNIGTTAVPGGLTPADGNDFSQPPQFTSSTELTVNSTSPIRGKGNPSTDLSGIASKDILGIPRTVRPGGGPDPGAYVVPEN